MSGFESEQHEQHAVRPWWYITPPPWWSFLFGLLTMIGSGVWHALSSGAGSGPALFARGFVWPGIAIGGVVALIVWLGWTLDLE